MSLWAISVAGAKVDGNNVNVDSGCCLVEAANRDEALGKAYRIAQRLMPVSGGWRGVHVKVSNEVLDPDNVVWKSGPQGTTP